MTSMSFKVSGSWRSLLEGDAAARALRAVERITADLRKFAANPSPTPPSWSRQTGREFSLCSGWAGIALFFAELDKVQPGQGHGELAIDLLERAIEGASGQRVLSSLYSGFPGVAWTLEHLRGSLLDDGEDDEDDEDPGEEAAAVLARYLGRSPWREDYDLISGLAGFGVYGLERCPRAFGQECLEKVVARLAETAEERPEGLAWRTPPERIAPEFRAPFPTGYFNLGTAHGAPGAIAVLARAWTAGIGGARPLLDDAVSWLLAQRLPPGAGSAFPAQVSPDPGETPEPSHLAWCYGDLGISCALLTAARCAGEGGWEREALEIARAAASRLPEDQNPRDACFCHGSAGNGHLFNRLYQQSGEIAFAEAAQSWFGLALNAAKSGVGFGGYQNWTAGHDGELGWQDEPGFLTGSAGVGLALLAALTSSEPAWDRVLLISIPRCQPGTDVSSAPSWRKHDEEEDP